MSDLVFRIESSVLNDVTDRFINRFDDIRADGRTFRLAYLEETGGIDEDAIVLIEPDTGDLYEVEFDVSVTKIERPKAAEDEPVVDPNQLSLLGGSS